MGFDMDKTESTLKAWEETVFCMKQEIQAKDKIILAQKAQIRHLENQVALLEGETKKLADAGNMLSKKCAELDHICIRQQLLLEEFHEMFSELS